MPACERCHGAGFLRRDRSVGDPEFGTLVACPSCSGHREQGRKARLAERISSECGLADVQRELTFASFQGYPGNEKALAAASSFAASGVASRAWLILQGKPGVGKTHLAAAIANAAISEGIPTIYSYVPHLLDHLRIGYRRKDSDDDGEYGQFEERFERICRAQLLILDDFGTQVTTPWVREKLETLINARYTGALATVITTNLDGSGIGNVSERILDRVNRYEPTTSLSINALRYREWKRQRAG